VSSSIVTLTMNPAIDVHTAVGQVLPNRKLRCSGSLREAGGGGVNVARVVRRLGDEATAIVPVGGISGRRLIELLASEGIETRTIPIAGETRETFTVSETGSGNQFRFVTEGPNLQESEWQAALDAIRSLRPVPAMLVASGSLPRGAPEDFYGRLSAIASDIGFRLIVDTSGVPLRHAVGPGTFLLKPNLAEFRDLTGGEAFSDLFLEGAAMALVATGKTKAVVISMGAAGAIYASEGGVRRIAAPTVRVESRVGAGDSMVGGIVVGLSRGLSFDDAVMFGVASGSAAVMTAGTQLCRREDAEHLFNEMRSRKSA